MKCFVTILSVALIAGGALAISEEQREAARQMAAKCMKETGATEEQVQRLRNGDTSNADSNTQCFVHCFFQGAGFVDSNGNIQEDHLVERLSTHYDRATAEELVQRCRNNNGANGCERSFRLAQCYIDNRASLM
ncbi:general odorant-binding protein 56a-like [Toxorhynchites rutilus septentrionalis]|uniref:general odorant-binding protein 56a-like n=1 Tax=Toxorhynchites rutilus septentrionalis TaxID=329112 RepID=UPI00247A9311|nr:general odorant-binding protein 56a-like [Toxorhynchites rutilus septentrionalis]